MSLFTRKKPKEAEVEPMTSYSPQNQMIDGIKRAVEAMPNLVYQEQQQQARSQSVQPQVIQQAPQQVQQPMQAVTQPEVLENPQSISMDNLIDAINEIDERLRFVEKLLRRQY